jgi:hypothetical protein
VPGEKCHGIGAALHDAFLDDAAERTAALSNLREETKALRLYEARGLANDPGRVLVPRNRRPRTGSWRWICRCAAEQPTLASAGWLVRPLGIDGE